ncbi:hypothetical protein BGZ94_005205 [Podila epigama]|nr:hypothetical protein BGZ94_005205 [Podila epigama]
MSVNGNVINTSLSSSDPLSATPNGGDASASGSIPVATKNGKDNSLVEVKSEVAPAPEPPKKRRPGRPPGYYLGPISCAYCRQQHRRCDYNQVCHRCIKANIPCDRRGTVERPTVIVRAARAAKKAEAEALAAAKREADIAAGIYVPPPPRRTKEDTPPPRRKRPLDHFGIVADNITEAKRSPVMRFDPSIFHRTKRQAQTRSSSSTPNPDGEQLCESIGDTLGNDENNNISSSSSSNNNDNSSSNSNAAAASSELKRSNRIRLSTQSSDAGSSSSASQENPRKKYTKRAIQPDEDESDKRIPIKRTRFADMEDENPTPSPKGDKQRKQSKQSKQSQKGKQVKQIKQSKQIKQIKKRKESKESKENKGSKKEKQNAEPEDSDVSAPVQLVKKSYLKSGLYSADLKLDPHKRLVKVSYIGKSKQHVLQPVHPAQVVTKTRSGRTTGTASALAAKLASNTRPSFFQLPVNYGAVLMSRQRDFYLPFDIMQAWKAGVLQKRREPEPFIKIRSIYLEFC